MKKLLIAVTAVASAFGLYAADAGFVSGTSFDDDGMVGVKDIGVLNAKDGNAWTTTDAEAAFEVKNYDDAGETASTDRPAKWVGEKTQTNFLEVKTKLDKTLTRAFSPEYQLSGGDVYVDTLVKFTACDEEITTLADSAAKLAVWVKEDETTGKNNLMVTAGYVNSLGGAVEPKNYDCGTFSDLDAWHRLTIKSIGDITASKGLVGFVVFVDGVAKGYATADESIGIDGYKDLLTPVATLWDKAGNLFPSLKGTGDGSISAIALSGQGKIDDITFTTTAPTFAEKGTVTFTWTPADFTAIEIGNETVDVTKGSYVCEYVAGQTYPISATAVEGKMVTSAGSFKPDAAGKSFEITTAAVAAKLVIDGAPQQFTTVAAAFTAIAGISSPVSKVELKLSAGYDQSITLNNSNIGEFVLDLAGQTLSGSPASIAVAVQAMTLTITNSTTTVGKVTGMVNGGMGTLNIQAGQFDGMVGASKGLFTGGSFKNTNQKVTLDARAPEGFEFVESEGYYTLKEKFLNGSGAETDPWQISNAAELKKLATYVADGGETDGKFFKQTADITWTTDDGTFPGIGAYSNTDNTSAGFKGTYDGNNKTIKNIKIASAKYAGIFTQLYGTVQNLTVENVSVDWTPDYTFKETNKFKTEVGGAMVASHVWGGTVTNVTTKGAFGSEDAPLTGSAGGIVCRVTGNGRIENCVNEAALYGAAAKIAGIMIICQNGTADEGVVIKNCENKGSINWVNKNNGDTAGGYAGIAAYVGNDKQVKIEGCTNSGTVTCALANADVGQIVGKIASGSVVSDGTFTVAADQLVVGSKACDGFNFATIDETKVTLVADNALAVGGSYKVMSPRKGAADANKATATIAFTAAEQTVSFDQTLATAKFAITSTTGVIETNEVENVITFTAKAAPTPQGGVVPGEPQSIGGQDMDEAAAKEAVKTMTVEPTATQKAAGLTAADFQVKAKAVAGGWVAVAEPADQYIPEVETEKTDVQPIEVTATDFSATIKNAKKGFYYGFVAADELKANVSFAPAATFVAPETDGELKLTAPKATGNARFYKLSVSAEPVTVTEEN